MMELCSLPGCKIFERMLFGFILIMNINLVDVAYYCLIPTES